MIRIVKLSLKAEYVESFMHFFNDRKNSIRHYEGCQHLELWQDENDKNVLFTYSIWLSLDDLESYRNSDFFKETWSTVKPWFSKKPEAFSVNKLMHV